MLHSKASVGTASESAGVQRDPLHFGQKGLNKKETRAWRARPTSGKNAAPGWGKGAAAPHTAAANSHRLITRLEPGLGMVTVVPWPNSNRNHCESQIGYLGTSNLPYRTKSKMVLPLCAAGRDRHLPVPTLPALSFCCPLYHGIFPSFYVCRKASDLAFCCCGAGDASLFFCLLENPATLPPPCILRAHYHGRLAFTDTDVRGAFRCSWRRWFFSRGSCNPRWWGDDPRTDTSDDSIRRGASTQRYLSIVT